MNRTDCYTATVSHCRGGEISTPAEQTVTLLLYLIAGVVRSLHEQNRLLHCYCLSLQGWWDLYMSRTDCYTATVSHCRGGEISTQAKQTVTVSLQGWFDLYTSRTDCYTSIVSHCRGGEISTWTEHTVTLLLSLIAGVVRSLHEEISLLPCYCLSLQGWWDLYMSRTDCYTATVSNCRVVWSLHEQNKLLLSHFRGDVISTLAEQTVTLLLSLIAGVVWSLHEQNRLLHCYYRSLQGWCVLYMNRTDCYTATVSHCRGGEISTRAEQTVTLLLSLIAKVVRSLHEQNRLLHCYYLSFQGWWDLYMNRTDCYTVTVSHCRGGVISTQAEQTVTVSLQGWLYLYTSRTDCYTATVSHCRGGEISTWAEQTVTQLLYLIAGVVRSLHEQNRLLHCYCISLQGWCDLYMTRTDCYTVTVSLCSGGAISTRTEQTVTLLLSLIAGVVQSLHE